VERGELGIPADERSLELPGEVRCALQQLDDPRRLSLFVLRRLEHRRLAQEADRRRSREDLACGGPL
jgi:hypothetical protein